TLVCGSVPESTLGELDGDDGDDDGIGEGEDCCADGADAAGVDGVRPPGDAADDASGAEAPFGLDDPPQPAADRTTNAAATAIRALTRNKGSTVLIRQPPQIMISPRRQECQQLGTLRLQLRTLR